MAQKFQVLMAQLRGPIRRAFERAIATARGRANMEQLIAAIENNSALDAMSAAGVRRGMWTELTESVRDVYKTGGAFTVSETVPRKFGMSFELQNIRAEEWLRLHSATQVTRLHFEIEKSIRNLLSAGLAAGNNPTSTALNIVGRIGENGRRQGGIIGLTAQQAGFVGNMAEDLADLDNRYFTRTLRDKRYDKAVRASFESGIVLPAELRGKILDKYSDRLLKYRGETIARTETLAAIHEANDEAMRQVVDEGLAQPEDIVKVWKHSFVGPKEWREGHHQMDGQQRPMQAEFENPLTGVFLPYPGSGPASEVINCRCTVEYKVDFIGIEARNNRQDKLETAPPSSVQLSPLGDARLLEESGRAFYEEGLSVQFSDALTRALRVYQDQFYLDLNSGLRTGYGTPKNRLRQTLTGSRLGHGNQLLEAFSESGAALKLTKDSSFFRGLGTTQSTELRKLGVGHVFNDPGFTSTTVDKATAVWFARKQTARAVLEIQVEKGTRVIAMNFSGASAELKEFEVLLGNGLRFQIISIEEDLANRVLIYKVKVV